MTIDRDFEEAYAHQHGFFWLPCTVCGEKFGGHEKGGGLMMTRTPKLYLATCPNCPGKWERIHNSDGTWTIRKAPETLTLDELTQ